MYSLEVIHTLNSNPPKRRDNFNRESSFNVTARHVILHSGVLRSTACISRGEHPASYAHALYWVEQPQHVVNAWIDASVAGQSLEQSDAAAVSAAFPDWRLSQGTRCGTQGDSSCRATRRTGELVESVAGLDWIDLHRRLVNLNKA